MPVALERALKRRASKLGLGKERKDAYVYGTLRKTGWKPSREKKMNTPNERLVRLAAIDKTLDSIVQFQDDQDYNQRRYPWLKTGAAVGTGAGAVLGHQAIQRAGGYGAVGKNISDYTGKVTGAFKTGAQQSSLAGGKTAANVLAGTRAAGAEVGQGIGKAAGSAWQNILKKLAGSAAKTLSSKEKLINLDATLMEPFQSQFESKIYQTQFPAGRSPLNLMRMPFPKLMAYMNRKNHLQTVFSEKQRRLIELNAKLDEIQLADPDDYEPQAATRRWREDRSGKTWKGAAVAVGGAAAGYGAYRGVKAGIKAVEPYQPLARGRAAGAAMGKAASRIIHGEPPLRSIPGRILKAGYRGARYARLPR